MPTPTQTPAPEHHTARVRCTSSDDMYDLLLPHAHRNHWVTWGDQDRVHWRDDKGNTKVGVEHARGPDGITALDMEGETHRIPHERYHVALGAKLGDDILPMAKAATAPKGGPRWITVHPNGKDEKGVPVKIEPSGDGRTWRVTGGAGGKLNHLKLDNVKPDTEENRKEWAKNAKDKKAKRVDKAEEVAKEDEGKPERESKGAELQHAKTLQQLAERRLVDKVREAVGGVDEDLPAEDLARLSKEARRTLEANHAKRQLRQARERLDKLKEQVTDDGVMEADARAAVRKASMEADPAVTKDARDLAQQALDLDETERKERRTDRARKATRHTKVKSGELAAEELQETIRKEGGADLAEKVEELGGRQGPGESGLAELASDDLKREVLQHREDAWILTQLADGAEVSPEDLAKVQASAQAENWAIDADDLAALAEHDEDDEGLAGLVHAARQEAGRKWRRAELREQRVANLERIEEEKGPGAAKSALAFARMSTRVAAEVRNAKDAGLGEGAASDLQQAEISEVVALLADAEKLRTAQGAVRELQQQLDRGDYGAARTSYKLTASDEVVFDKAMAKIQDEVRTQLTEQLTGLSNFDAEHMRAAAAGQFDSLSDVTLGIASQRYLPREVVDGLGLRNSTVLLRHALEADGHDPEAVSKALEAHHVGRMEQITADALAKAKEIAPDLVDAVHDVHDMEKALTQVEVADADLVEMQRALGSAIGRMEATAVMGQAFREPIPDHLLLHHGGDREGTLRWAQAMGLKRGDYEWSDDGLVIHRDAWGSLLHRDPPEEIKRRQAVDAIKAGKQDEDGWLPQGIVAHSKEWFSPPPPVGDRPSLVEPLELTQGGKHLEGGALSSAMEKHILSRLAEGEDVWTVRREMMSPAVLRGHPDSAAVVAAIDRVLPVMGVDEYGRPKPKDARQIEKMLTSRVGKWAKGTGHDGGIYTQSVDFSDAKVREAVFHTHTEQPWAAAAFKDRGALDSEDRASLRSFWEKHVKARADQETGADTHEKMVDMAHKISAEEGQTEKQAQFVNDVLSLGNEPPKEPPKNLLNLFADPRTHDKENPEYTHWHKRYAAIRERYDDILKIQRPGTWEGFVWAHRGAHKAYLSLQHAARGHVNEALAKNLQRSGTNIRTSTVDVPYKDHFILGAGTAEVVQEARTRTKSVQGAVQTRGVGPSGKNVWTGDDNVQSKMMDSKAQEDIGGKQQVGMFGLPDPEPKKAEEAHGNLVEGEKGEKGLGRRTYVGPRIEKALAEAFSSTNLGSSGEATDLFPGLSMDGDRVDQQRAVKTMQANGGRLGGWLGTGSGKSLISIGACTDAIERGETKKGIFLAPTSVVEQFSGEMLRFTKPGQYRWQTGTGMDHDARVAALKGDSHMVVMTHQSFRDTATRIMAEHHGMSPAEMTQRMGEVDRHARARMMREAFDAVGIPKSYVYVDEAHMGSEDSGMGMVKSAITHPDNASHMLLGTATPHKNNTKEMAEMAALIHPHRYGDKEAFLRDFGEHPRYNSDSLRREMAPYTYSAKIDPSGVDRIDSSNPRMVDGKKVTTDEPIPLHPKQQEAVDRVRGAYDRARAARKAGRMDMDALREIHPSRFAGKTPAEAHAIGEAMQSSLGMARDQALRRAINQAPAGQNAKLDAMLDVVQHDVAHGQWRHKDGTTHVGKPTIIFSDSKVEANQIHAELVKRGIRSATFTGDHTTKQREKTRKGFGKTHDVIVATKAMEAGVNAQAAKVVHHYDVPETQKSHAQRSGRAYRQGQKGDVEIHNHHTADPYEQNGLRRLRRKKGLASVFETPIRNMDETGIAAHYQAAIAEKNAGQPGLFA